MSGYEKSNTSKLGGGAPGGVPSAGFANTNTVQKWPLSVKFYVKHSKQIRLLFKTIRKSAQCAVLSVQPTT